MKGSVEVVVAGEGGGGVGENEGGSWRRSRQIKQKMRWTNRRRRRRSRQRKQKMRWTNRNRRSRNRGQ